MPKKSEPIRGTFRVNMEGDSAARLNPPRKRGNPAASRPLRGTFPVNMENDKAARFIPKKG